MKGFIKFFVVGLLLLESSYALDIDERLTFRILSVSQSKKTVLMNRGIEDGLVEGNHAKFFLTTGVFARAVVVRVSPTRSVWSVYRIVDDSQLVQDRVLNLKISAPLKLTDDPTKSLKIETMGPGSDTISISMAEGANDLPKDLTDEEMSDFKDFNTSSKSSGGFFSNQKGSVDPNRSLEVWGMLHLSQLSGDFQQGDIASSTSSEESLVFSLGVEKYFPKSTGFIGQSSIGAFIHKRTNTVGDTQKTTADWLEYGIMANYHFFASPLAVNQMIGVVSLGAGMGTVTSTLESSTSTTSTTESLDGSSNFFSVGGGIKYYLSNGFGMRLFADYYRSGATFSLEDAGADDEATLTVSGLRFQVGVSYRF